MIGSALSPAADRIDRTATTRMTNVLIVNAYAIGNWGDTAIVEGLIHALRMAGATRIAVAPSDWETRRQEWLGIGADEVVPPLLSHASGSRWARRSKVTRGAQLAVRWMRYVAASKDRSMQSYREADVVAVAGGGWAGGWKPGASFIKLGNVRAAALAGRPCVVAPISINPPSLVVQGMLKWGFRDALLFVRDRPSLERAQELGLAAALVPDAAFLAPTLARAASSDLRPPSTADVLGWVPRNYRRDHRRWGAPESTEAALAAAVAPLVGTRFREVRLFTHVQVSEVDDDSTAVLRVAARLRAQAVPSGRVVLAPSARSLAEATAQYGSVGVLITSRMHAAIFALASSVPSLVVGYEPKVSGVMELLGLGDWVVPVDILESHRQLRARIEALLDPRQSERARLAWEAARQKFGPFHSALKNVLGH
jgi:polysaccharide pyruvyl transferase WcaK-like protein